LSIHEKMLEDERRHLSWLYSQRETMHPLDWSNFVNRSEKAVEDLERLTASEGKGRKR